jgi:hypothetical protein
MKFRIGDREAVDGFYDNTFHCVQQLALKAILKAWIKIWDPNKQKQHPYTLGVRPDYWPESIRYQEPDHILKVGPSFDSFQRYFLPITNTVTDRQPLAVHLIHLAQGADDTGEKIDQLEKALAVSKTEFDNEPKDKIERRRQLLKQLFQVVRKEAMMLRGEIGLSPLPPQ